MKSIKLEKIFRKLTLMSFTLFMIGMIIGFMLDVVFNIKTNTQYIVIWGKFMFGFIFIVGILWDIFYLVNRVRETSQYINENKEEIIETGKDILKIPNDIKNGYTSLMKDDKILLKDKILGTAFIIWFIVSMVLMIYFKGNFMIEIILISQYVIVFILALIFGRRK